MLKVLRSDKDTYVTDRVIDGARVHDSNVGGAGTLDLFKLYGVSTSGSAPNVELSRLLVHFDLSWVSGALAARTIDVNHPSFKCALKLFDVYGGQPTPRDFGVNVYPLSRSFDEGLGRDVVLYADRDVCNFLTSSWAQGAWVSSGANAGGFATSTCDYITSASIAGNTVSFLSHQQFVAGTEDLSVDVTSAVSASLIGAIPDAGFRVALDPSIEVDNRTYFVKRFAGRTAYNESKRPALWITYDDSIQDDTLDIRLDEPATLWLYNFSQGHASNIVSASQAITGSNSLLLTLSTPISGGTYSVSFTGSQHTSGINPVTGYYSASVILNSSNANIAYKLTQTGSVDFTPVWGSLDGSVGYYTGSTVTVRPTQRGNSLPGHRRYTVTSTGVGSDVYTSDAVTIRVNIFDAYTAAIKAFRTAVVLPTAVIRDVHWSVRDPISDTVVIPFDETTNATRVSSDADGMYFTLDPSLLTAGGVYTIDVLINNDGARQVYRTTCAAFRVRA